MLIILLRFNSTIVQLTVSAKSAYFATAGRFQFYYSTINSRWLTFPVLRVLRFNSTIVQLTVEVQPDG